MNEQKSDSVSQEPISAPLEVPQTPAPTEKEHKSVLDSITKLWHKKNIEITVQKTEFPTETPTPPNIPLSTSVWEASKDLQNSSPHPEKGYKHISEKIAHIFHKTFPPKHIEAPEIQKVAESILIEAPETPKEAETAVVIDERFARLLEHDTTYHSMLRSEDIKNIQLQLSMRYMILMLAIFVVIAWVVNNRVIMFWFSDFPFLARTRDALFVLLTGLFSLTVWFGSAVWFRHRMGVLILRILAATLFTVVLLSIYLPFLW